MESEAPITQKLSTQDVRRRIDAVPFWFHSIDVGQGLTTPGKKTVETLRDELQSLRLPEMKGKTVLDIGAFDGFYSFEAERRGASAVTALDHYVWSMDLEAHDRHWQESRERGEVPRAYQEMPYWKPSELPGKRGFDTSPMYGGADRVLAAAPRLRVVEGDVHDLEALAPVVSGNDVAIHLASNPDIARAATEPQGKQVSTNGAKNAWTWYTSSFSQTGPQFSHQATRSARTDCRGEALEVGISSRMGPLPCYNGG